MGFFVGLACGVSVGAAIATWFFKTIKNDGYPMVNDLGEVYYPKVRKNRVSDRY